MVLEGVFVVNLAMLGPVMFKILLMVDVITTGRREGLVVLCFFIG